ncbi:N-acetylmuramoyl-L-alanine amidase [Thermosulfurimonas dismutans]|uniref:N-acetylmuramoyl-L-alanine amidase n=1 Tax=Thermosulfurimonas dismutans TaxID=999894 RepID=A0A179D6G9_9BACT|nr:N-acetylmuramoyl-L-alanine amidase [Thermosulfurimonas dismutans]OAQ21042.1 N-acetylmuramoyl-L-alanine amidase [Thermosulfurimonas dismutans]
MNFLLWRVFLLLFLIFLFPLKLQALTASEKAFLSAKKELERFAKSPRVKYRRYWLNIINRFRRVYLRYPESPEAPKALIWTARLYRNLYGYSHNQKDLKEALRRYRMLWEHYPKSALADDALYEAAEIYEKFLKDPQKVQELRDILLKRYPNGDMAPKVRGPKSTPETYSPKKPDKEPKISGKALVKGVRHWSGEDYSRVVVDLTKRIHFDDHVLKAHQGKPPRVYVDLKPARLSPYVKPEIPIQDGLLTRVRLGQYLPDTVRVVLDLKSFTSHRTFYLGDPPRLVIDLIGEEAEKARFKPLPAGKYSLAQQLGLKIHRIVIDPGHGGRDPGALGLYGLKEKHITLKVSKYLAEELKNCLGCEVILTRDRDIFLPLIKRPAIANLKRADLFVSIHVNAAPNRKSRGIETYYLSFTTDPEAMRVAALENAVSNQSLSDLQNLLKKILRNTKIEESKRLAQKVQTALVKRLSRKYRGVRNLGVKKAPFVVLVGTRMPAILVEISFITNPTEAKRLRSEAYLREVARGIAEGIKNYVREIQVAGK